jgi:hypothetical protein
MPEDRVEQQPPEVLAMVLADHIHRDQATGKFSILGTYAVIGAATFPARIPVIQVYASLIDGRGPTKVKLVLVDADGERGPVFTNEVTVPFANPTQTMEVHFVHLGAEFPEPGDYCVQLYAAGELLRELRLKVLPTDMQSDDDDEEDYDNDEPDEEEDQP